MLLLPPTLGEGALVVAARRPSGGELETVDVRALGPGGEVVGRSRLVFEPGAARAEAALELPLDLRNRIARLELQPRAAIGGVVLLDERWRRRVIGLVGATSGQAAQPLLSELYYIERALSPHAELRTGTIAELLDDGLSVLVLADGAQIGPEARAQLVDWIAAGGVLLRFAGPRLANAEDDLVPVTLRRGDRNLGGALSWSRPLPLGEFPDPGPLAGLPVAEGDVVVRRQVLAQPGPDLAARTWARLADGTPLITGEQRGAGWLVLIHTTANPSWSTLPLSGVFVDVLRRIAALARGAGGSHQGLLTPIEVLDASGRLAKPSPAVQPIPAADFAAAIASPIHPPGLYGPLEAGDQVARQALNLASAVPELPGPFAVRLRRPTARLRGLGRDRPAAVAVAGGAAAGPDRHPDRPASARPRLGPRPRRAGGFFDPSRSGSPRSGLGGTGGGGRRAGDRGHLGHPSGLCPDRPGRGRRGQPRRSRRPQPGAQPADRGRGRHAAGGRPGARRPQSVPAALLAGHRRSSGARRRRRRAAGRLSPAGRHDPVRHRRCRHDDSGAGRPRPGRAPPAPSCSPASICRRWSRCPRITP